MGHKIFVRAAPGALSSALTSAFEDEAFSLILADYDPLEENSIFAKLESKLPSLVVNAKAYAPVDDPQEDKILSHLVEFCAEHKVPLIHLSNYRVYGEAAEVSSLVLKENLVAQPQETHGSLLLDEEALVASLDRHVIIRASWMLNGDGQNLFDVIIPLLMKNEAFNVSDHNYGRPVKISFLASLILALTQQIMCGAENWGVFHLHSADQCSEAEICDALVRIISAEVDKKLSMPSVSGKGDERRLFAGNALLKGSRFKNDFGIQLPSWRRGLKTQVSAYLREKGFK